MNVPDSRCVKAKKIELYHEREAHAVMQLLDLGMKIYLSFSLPIRRIQYDSVSHMPNQKLPRRKMTLRTFYRQIRLRVFPHNVERAQPQSVHARDMDMTYGVVNVKWT